MLNRLKSTHLLLAMLFIIVSCGGGDINTTDNAPPEGTPAVLYNPLFDEQWHLENSGQNEGTAGEDINITNVWASANFGENVTVAVVDDGLEIAHVGLSPNISSSVSSYNYITATTDPSPTYSEDAHGTCVAGVIAAKETSSDWARGVAPRANLVGYNLLQNVTSSNQANAMTRNIASIDVSNNSWGNYDEGHFYELDASWSSAVTTGLTTGRGGKGTVYVWAAGNGGYINDQSQYDPYSGHYGVIAVCAVDNNGEQHLYSERGTNLWVCAPSGLFEYGITTTDLTGTSMGYNSLTSHLDDYTNYDYTNTFNGTSASAPMVSGVVALMLSENPDLTWRDVRMILAASARKNDASDSEWENNIAGYSVNYKYGFGVVDADTAVTLASSWTNKTFRASEEYTASPGSTIPSDGSAVTSTITVATAIANIDFLEVTVTLTAPDSDWGNLEITLKRSGETFESVLAEAHNCYVTNSSSTEKCTVNSGSFTFGVSRHFQEDPDGDWILEVKKGKNTGDGKTGTLTEWKLKIHGT